MPTSFLAALFQTVRSFLVSDSTGESELITIWLLVSKLPVLRVLQVNQSRRIKGLPV